MLDLMILLMPIILLKAYTLLRLNFCLVTSPPNPVCSLSHRIGGNKNALNNRRTRIKTARNSVFDCHLSPVGRQLAIENSVSITVFDCDLYLSGVMIIPLVFPLSEVTSSDITCRAFSFKSRTNIQHHQF